jgi:hypothetical protein
MEMSTMASSIEMYEKLLAAEDDRARARIIVEGFERLEDRYPELRDLATASGVRESELALHKDIEQTQLRIEEVRTELGKEIEQTRLRIEEVRADLGRDIERQRADTGRDIEASRLSGIRWTLGIMVAQTAIIVSVIVALQ